MPVKTSTGRIYKSPLGSDSSGLKYESLGDAYCQRLEANTEKVLFVEYETGKEWTGRQIKSIILNIAAYMIEEYGLEQKETVCIHYDHSINSTLMTLGVICAGGCIVQTDKLLSFDEIVNVVKQTQVKFWFSYADCVDHAQKFSLPIRASLSLDGDLSQLFNYVAQTDLKLPVACQDIEKKTDLAFILFSSGTSGLPKAVGRTHANELLLFSDMTLKISRGNEVTISDTPFSYLTGVIKLTSGIHHGMKSIFGSFKELSKLIDVIEKYRVTRLLVGMGTLYEFMVCPETKKRDISSIHLVTFGGAKMSFLQVAKQFFNEHPHIKELRTVYGMTEAGGLTLRFGEPNVYLQEPGNCGFLLPDCEMKIVDPEDYSVVLPVNSVGMICAKSPSIFPGYISRDGSLAILKDDPNVFDADGFYITGDIGYFDEHENMHIEGRYKETIVCRNLLKVLPFELEVTLTSHPSVASACVLGFQSELNPTLMKPRAFVTLDPSIYALRSASEYKGYNDVENDECDEQLKFLSRRGSHKLCSLDTNLRHAIELDIAKFMKEKLSYEKQLIGGIIVLDVVPKMHPSEKIDKRLLRALDESSVEIFGELPE